MRLRFRFFFYLAALYSLLSAVYAENLLYREYTPVWVRVDSSARGYSSAPATDGIILKVEDATTTHPLGPLGNAGNAWHSWISDATHWIEFRTASPRALKRLDVWWGPRRLWPRAAGLQAWTGDGWHNLLGDDKWHEVKTQHTRFLLDGVTTDRVRLLQRIGGGGSGQPDGMCVVEAKLLFEDESETGPVCRAGNPDFPALAQGLQDGRLLTWSLLNTSATQVLQATLVSPTTLKQAIFDFLIYNGECYAPTGETNLQLLQGDIWKNVAIDHLENWSEEKSLGVAQGMGRVRWIYNLDSATCSGVRLLFADGLENSVVCTSISASASATVEATSRESALFKSTQPNSTNLLAVVPYTLSLAAIKDKAKRDIITLPMEFDLHPKGRDVTLQMSTPRMFSRIEIEYEGEADISLSSFIDGEEVSVGRPRILKDVKKAIFTLDPVAVDRIGLAFSGKARKKIRIDALSISLDDDGRWSLRAVQDYPGDMWAERILAEGEPNYANSAALMLPRRDYRTVVGCPNDGDETAIAWNGTHFLRRRDDPRGSSLEHFFAFRIDDENFGDDFDAIESGWLDGPLPERFFTYDKDDVVATVRSFAEVDSEGESGNRLWMEVVLRNTSKQQRNGYLDVPTGLRRCGKSGRIGLYWDLPIADTVRAASDRLLLNELDKPILQSSEFFELTGTEAEPACRFAYSLSPGQEMRISLVAIADAPPDMALLPIGNIEAARAQSTEYWNRKLTSNMKISLPEKRLEQLYTHFIAQCLIIPDWGLPLYGSYFYEDTLCVEEVWPTVALAQYGYFSEAERHAESMLQIAVRDTRSRHKQYRKGLAPACVWKVYQHSRNKQFLERMMPMMKTCAEYINTERQKTMIMNDGKKTGYYGLLPRFVYGGDIAQPAYGLYANACAWRGLRDIGLAARALADDDLADKYQRQASEYRGDIMAVVDRVTDRSSDPIFTPLSIGRNSSDTSEAFPAGDATPKLLHQDRISSYWSLFAGLLLETGIFEPRSEYTTGMLETLKKKAGLWDGQVRFAYEGADWDPHYGYGLHRMWYQRDERGLFLTAFYGFLANNLSRNSWTHGEVDNVFPLRTNNFAQRLVAYDKIWRQRDYKNSEPLSSGPGIMLCDLRDMLVCERRDSLDQISGGLDLLRNAPGAWLTDSEDIVVENAPTAYGLLSYRVHCELDKRKRITIEVNLNSKEKIPVRIYANPVGRGKIRKARWKNIKESENGTNWTQAAFLGKAKLVLQF
jgi:hypothetical protein